MKTIIFNLLAVAAIIATMFFLAEPAKAQSKKQMVKAINAQAENAKAQADAIENLQTKMNGLGEKIDNLNPDKIMDEFQLKLAEVMETSVAALKAELAEMKPAEKSASAKTGTKAPAGKPEAGVANTTAKPKPPVPLKPGQVKYDSNAKEAYYLPGDTLAAKNVRAGFFGKEIKDETRSLKKGQFLEDYNGKEYRRLTSDTEVAKKYPVLPGYTEGTDTR